MLDIVVTVAIGFALGVLIGLTGVGGGAVVAPALYVGLDMGYTAAVAMSLVYSVFTKVLSFLQHLRFGNVDWKLTFVFSAAAIPGAVVGARVIYYAGAGHERFFALAMAAILAAVAALILAEATIGALAKRAKPFDIARLGAGAVAVTSTISFVVGLLVGMTSVGSGSIIVVSMVFLFSMPARRIVGSNIAIALVMVIPAGLTHVMASGVEVRRLGLLMLGSVAGAALGSRGTTWLLDRDLKLVIAVVILVSAVATVVKAW